LRTYLGVNTQFPGERSSKDDNATAKAFWLWSAFCLFVWFGLVLKQYINITITLDINIKPNEENLLWLLVLLVTCGEASRGHVSAVTLKALLLDGRCTQSAFGFVKTT